MPSKSSSSGQRRAQGGGRTPNSEPKVQVFRDFAGVNFENAPQYIDESGVVTPRGSGDQTDLQMNYVFLQNNVAVASNKTLVSREDLVRMFDAPGGVEFTGPAKMVGNWLYLAKDDDQVGYAHMSDYYDHERTHVVSDNLSLVNNTNYDHTWTSFEFYDDKLIALTRQGEIWTGRTGTSGPAPTLQNAKPIANPTLALPFSSLSARGSLAIVSDSPTTSCPFRINLAYSIVNEYGPTKLAPTLTFYASKPVSEWDGSAWLRIDYSLSTSLEATAVELYYTTDNAMSMLFLGRCSVTSGGVWAYNWYGYVDATTEWLEGNLVAPTENYTRGVQASRVTCIDGRLYFWGCSGEPERLYIGGNPGNLLSVSPGVGGGFVDVEPGSGKSVRYVCKYKTQAGNSIVTMLCDSPNTRREQRFNLVENNVSLSNEQSMKSWQAEQVAGAVGCKSYDGALVCQDGLYSVTRYGLALTTLTMEYNSQIRTTYVSDQIKPVFTDAVEAERRLRSAMLLELDGILYMALGASSQSDGVYDNILFCYDIDQKAWWTYTIGSDDEPILGLFHMDPEDYREGIGVVTPRSVYLLPTTNGDDEDAATMHTFLIETAELSTQMPQQGWQYLSQLEFHFDRIVGYVSFEVRMRDMFGRDIKVEKSVNMSQEAFNHSVRMRIDQRVMSYVITISGSARFRLTHFIARVYTLSNKIGQVWGFDDSISHRSAGSVHPTFRCYNDVREAIFT